MKFLNNRIAGPSILITAALLYIVLTMAVRIPLNNIDSKIWEGYYTLVLEADAPVLSIIADLQRFDEWEVVSEYNSKIQVFSYDKEVYVPVSGLQDYYVDRDPLYDPFLRKLPSLFRAKSPYDDYKIVYIRTDFSSSVFLSKITDIMDNYSYKWFIPEIKKENPAIGIAVFIMSMALLLILNKKSWPFLIPGIVPWFLFAIYSGFYGVLVSITFLFGWILFVSQLYNSFSHYLNLGKFDPVDKKKVLISIVIMIISVFYLLFNMRTIHDISAYSLALFAHLCAVAFYVIILWYKRRMQQHRIFFPVRIRLKSQNTNMLDFVIFSFFVMIIIIYPLTNRINRSDIDFKLPVPVEIPGISDFSQVSMKILNKHSGQSELPNLSDYIAHMIFLETYPYGYQYSFPETDQLFEIPRFSIEKGVVIKKNVSINMFTDSWYKSIMTKSSNKGIIRLLLCSNSPVLVGYQAEELGFVSDSLLRSHYLISIFLVVALIVWLSNLSLSDWYGFKELVLRRKQQVV